MNHIQLWTVRSDKTRVNVNRELVTHNHAVWNDKVFGTRKKSFSFESEVDFRTLVS